MELGKEVVETGRNWLKLVETGRNSQEPFATGDSTCWWPQSSLHQQKQNGKERSRCKICKADARRVRHPHPSA